MFNYVKIPREIIYDKSMNDKRIVIFSYLCARRSLDDTVAFSTTELCRWSKLKPNYRDGKINQKYYEVLLLLSHYGYFEECPDFESYLLENTNSEKYRIVKLNIDKFEPNENFAMIYFDEIEKILNFKTELENIDIDLKRMSSAYILLVLSYIRVNLNRQTDKPLCCYRYIKTIHEDIGLSERYISRVIEILDKLNIVKSVKMKRIRYEESGASKFLTTPTVFADYRKLTKNVFGDVEIDGNYDYREEIKKQIEIIKNRFSKRE